MKVTKTKKTEDRCSTQLAEINIDPQFAELTAAVVSVILPRKLLGVGNGLKIIWRGNCPDAAKV